MATVQSYTKEFMDSILDNTIVDAEVVAGNLILEKNDGSTINAGSVIGPTGATGSTGPAGSNGTMQLVAKHEMNTNLPSMSADANGDLVLNNVPVVNGRTYGIRTHMTGITVSFGGSPTPRVDIWLQKNAALFKKVGRIELGDGGGALAIDNEVFWTPTVTGATDDFSYFFDFVFTGLVVQIVDVERSISIVDYGDLTP